MKWIAITGGIGSGKSSVCKQLRQMGFEVVDADEVVHQLLKPGEEVYKKVISYFGPKIVTEHQLIDNKKLAQLVFNDKKKLLQLESIIHPAVQAQVLERKKELDKRGVKLGFYDVPLLYEKSLQGSFDAVIVVYASLNQQIERTMKRNQMTKEEVLHRIQNQIPLEDKKLTADFVIDNTGDKENIAKAMTNIVTQLTSD